MNRVFSWLQNHFLGQIFTVLLVGFVFFTAQAFSSGNALAEETVKSPYGYYYKGTPDAAQTGSTRDGNKLVESAKNNLKDAAGNVREGAKNLLTPSEQPHERASATRNEIEQAQGETVKSPYGYYYKGTPEEGKVENHANNIKSANPLKEIADNVREKLNLDEPLPESTKEFLNSTEKSVEKAVEPITGIKEGYYQTP
ncbi:MAG: hypothetical protein KME60_32610 [Cyanomargarita calcarea GSE-NOS-MK-12-04C]|jgi:hypothetical protein|uniref:Uncharacterized protein n=1 Tax=Cyanomargarita calcarea GSE-NOS-MK-12-04C TaxID=2839659 RepID=A0A951UWH8_9CYAN|nr:hypothetical protein [Cyanomargarita calcarea GSE-NOS-MK-12-04C]